MMNKIKNKIKDFLVNTFSVNLVLIIALIILIPKAYSKPIPPGSGEGDVPANILFLLDSSKSMKASITGGSYLGLEGVDWSVALSNGDIIIAEQGRGLVKVSVADNKLDDSFAKNKKNFTGKSNDTDCKTGNKNSLITNSRAGAISSDGTIYAAAYSPKGKVVAIDSNGKCVGVIPYGWHGIAQPRMIDIATIGGNDYLFVSGHTNVRQGRRNVFVGYFYVLNIGSGSSIIKSNGYNCNVKDNILVTVSKEKSGTFAINKNGTHVYFARKGNLWSFPLNATDKCPSKQPDFTVSPKNGNANKYEEQIKADGSTKPKLIGTSKIVGDMNHVSSVATSKNNNNILFVTSHHDHTVQKIEVDHDAPSVEVKLSIGKLGIKTAGEAGEVPADDIIFSEPGVNGGDRKTAENIHVNTTHIYVGSRNGAIQKMDVTKFNDTDKDTMWLGQYGGAKVSRFDGAKEAIIDIISDSSLQAGANFGFGHWNGGERDVGNTNNYPGERFCHKNDGCKYYQNGWNNSIAHPKGTSEQCNVHSCLNVGVHADGWQDIPDVLLGLGMKFATDANAFADIAHGYYMDADDETNIIDPTKSCQLNYVIVIGDGRMFNETNSIPKIKEIRQELGVRTLFIAYGGAYQDGVAKPIFDRFAKAGSCDVDGADECEETIEASSPQQLKVVLESKIRQIIADRLSFTAPSVTATIQEGGAIYQAQFNYEPNGEWRGRLLRKAIRADNGAVEQDLDYADENGKNWDAGAKLLEKGSAGRKIWTVLEDPAAGYIGNWNNWRPKYSDQINNLFEFTGNVVEDYHNPSSFCGKGENGNLDDISGLINFIRGVDYFDYNAGCDIEEDRGSILADIYHSQLVEVGAPAANTVFQSNNSEAYYRSVSGYGGFKKALKDRPRMIYAGSNGGMLHAFNATDGSEEWAFVPPMIASQMPLIFNKAYDGKIKAPPGRTGKAGGSNAIFGVDGSPIIHDAKIYHLEEGASGELQYSDVKRWRTLLMIPYGRGGAGFSVLDVTYPKIISGDVDEEGNPVLDEDGNTVIGGQGPLHMFSIYNDTYNKRIVRVDHNGDINTFRYSGSSFDLSDSREAQRATQNQTTARNNDGNSDTDFTNRDNIKDCQSDADYTTNFRTEGTNACYKGKTFTFTDVDLKPTAFSGNELQTGFLDVFIKDNDDWTRYEVGPDSTIQGKKDGAELILTFSSDKVFNDGEDTTEKTSRVKIESKCINAGTSNIKYDYSQMGETWSTPRILRVPQLDNNGKTTGSIQTDRYVAVMGAGYASTSRCSGSGLYLIDLEAGSELTEEIDDSGTGDDRGLTHEAGRLYGLFTGSETVSGAVRFLDSEPKDDADESTIVKESDIKNHVTATPVLITADVVTDVPWRGGLVYINDMEGKIMKVNLTTQGTFLEYQYLMNLGANSSNKRHSFFEMDAAIGTSTGNFWLFGGTGNFNRISEIDTELSLMDNIVYGIRDFDFPNFDSESLTTLPNTYDEAKAIEALNNAPLIDDQIVCANATGENFPTCSTSGSNLGWKYHLGVADGVNMKQSLTANNFRKTSGPPTIYRGKVYFPIYQPDKTDNCNLGTAYVCAHDDECGSLDSLHIDSSVAEGSCFEVGAGILSKLVVFGGRLFANLAGPTLDKDTLVEILATDKEYRSFRRSWRENF